LNVRAKAAVYRSLAHLYQKNRKTVLKVGIINNALLRSSSDSEEGKSKTLFDRSARGNFRVIVISFEKCVSLQRDHEWMTYDRPRHALAPLDSEMVSN
jgi:hypothetical protein